MRTYPAPPRLQFAEIRVRGKPLNRHTARDLAFRVSELSQELGLVQTRVGRLGSCSGRGRLLPILKRFASESAERIAGNEMALDVEGVLDRGVNGEEPLG
jgi:hypothetical protein